MVFDATKRKIDLQSAATSTRGKASDVRVMRAQLFLLPVETRVPLKFGTETLTSVTCARVCLTVVSRDGRTAVGWGETPLSVQWGWPSELSLAARAAALEEFSRHLAKAWTNTQTIGHPMEVGDLFRQSELENLLQLVNHDRGNEEPIPLLAALICCSPFDIALHDAYGTLVGRPVYETYVADFMNHDLSWYFEPGDAGEFDFRGKFPADFFKQPTEVELPVWHLVGGLDPLDSSEVNGAGPADGHPHALDDWIQRDGLDCLKVKLRGNDADWDYQRLLSIGNISDETGVRNLTADFNCTVTDPQYVIEILDRLREKARSTWDKILYVEQPFPYDLKAHSVDVHSVAARKPLLMDESAHDWRVVQLGRSLGWNGVALKTCKTQTGAILSLCWAKAHGMHLMVQDLTNPMLAQIPHVLLAAHTDTMLGVESNAMQFYPDASRPEAAVHPGLYQRRNGLLDLSSISGNGFGYRLDEIDRELPPPVAEFSRTE